MNEPPVERTFPYDAGAWEQVDRGELPEDELAAAFFHLARVEERDGARDEHGRFRAEWSCLDRVRRFSLPVTGVSR